ncbi:hypothetical protein ACFSUK_15690 [Sphingobium scionense]|jgi:hypothetical protein|uniref:Uncharacterized protein n=1 Tax=Sphingobium scionense TaxID=1404341 RepID=A0A7W6LQ84_9SPHN|nr:hypothetical protein [Sphingobium scionense]MBB4148489.1 hypothetical protein [Sphingobium scionense]
MRDHPFIPAFGRVSRGANRETFLPIAAQQRELCAMVRDWSAMVAAGAGICVALVTASGMSAPQDATPTVRLAPPALPWLDNLTSDKPAVRADQQRANSR